MVSWLVRSGSCVSSALSNVDFTSPCSLETSVRFTEDHLIWTGIMAYQFKLAEKLIILNERGQGVLVRMNHIKKVRGK